MTDTFKNEKCSYCGKIGHWRPDCPEIFGVYVNTLKSADDLQKAIVTTVKASKPLSFHVPEPINGRGMLIDMMGCYLTNIDEKNIMIFPPRILCCQCFNPTNRCEDDELYIYGDKESNGPYCEECFEANTGRKASVKYFDSGGKKR